MYSQLQNLYPILLSDTIVYDRPMMLYIGTGGSLRVLTSGGDDVTLRNVPDGSTLPILVSKVFATGSTVGNVLATQFDGDVLSYFSTLPSWVLREFSLAFDAEGAEELGDYEAGTLYFRDSNFNRVPATFSRTTTATRVNEQGLIETVATNVPRIDYTDGSAKLLMEPSRTNIIKYSEDFRNTAQAGESRPWFYAAVGTASVPIVTHNYAISPDGTTNATRIQFDLNGGTTSNDVSQVGQDPTITIGVAYTATIWLKSADGNSYSVAIDTNGGTDPSLLATVTNQWQRFQVTTTAITVNGFLRIRLRGNESTSDSADILAWGAQLEEGSYPTSYIPTAGSAVTRNEDSFQNNSLGSYFNTNEGSIYWKYTDNPLLLSTVNINSFGVNEVFGSKYIRYRGRDDASLIQSTGIANNISFAGTDIHLLSYSVRWDGTNLSVFGDSSLIDSEPQSDDFNPVSFGYSSGGIDASVTTKYEKIIFFPTALTDDQCKDLTLDGYDSYEAMAAALGYTTY